MGRDRARPLSAHHAGDIWPVIQFLRPSTSQLTEIVTLPKETKIYANPSHFAVSQDGRWILYVQVDSIESDLTLVENFQ
jgi:hypothetical protein